MSLLRNLSVLSVLSLTACGFEPLYKQTPAPEAGQTAEAPDQPEYTENVARQLAQVDIITIDYFGRPGQVLQSRLEDILNPTHAPTQPIYELKVNLTKNREALLVERDAEITRYRLITFADIELRDAQTAEVIMQDTIRLTSSFDAVQSDFATYTAEQEALTNLMRQMATRIRFQLTDYFIGRTSQQAEAGS